MSFTGRENWGLHPEIIKQKEVTKYEHEAGAESVEYY